MPVKSRSQILAFERPEISIRVLLDRIASCEDPARRKLLKADFLSKLQDLPTDSYFWNQAEIFLSEFPDEVEKMRKRIKEKKRTIGVLIITVRDDEIQSLRSMFPSDGTAESNQSENLKYDEKATCYKGCIKCGDRDVKVVVAQNNKTGQTDAAANTTAFIHSFTEITGENLDYAVLVGICAGSRQRDTVELGDIVVPSEIFSTDVYKLTRENGQAKRSEELRCPGKPHIHLLRLCRGVHQKKEWWKATHLKNVAGHKYPPDVHLDPLFTDGFFLEDPEYMEKCQDLYNRKAIAYEMEAGGFATACYNKDIPFLVVRGISDWADEKASDKTWRSYSSQTATAFMYELLKIASIPTR